MQPVRIVIRRKIEQKNKMQLRTRSKRVYKKLRNNKTIVCYCVCIRVDEEEEEEDSQ